MFSPITGKSLQLYKPSRILTCTTSVSDRGIPAIYIGDQQFSYTITDREHLRDVGSWFNFNAADNRRGFIEWERAFRRIKTPLKEMTCAQLWTNFNQSWLIFWTLSIASGWHFTFRSLVLWINVDMWHLFYCAHYKSLSSIHVSFRLGVSNGHIGIWSFPSLST